VGDSFVLTHNTRVGASETAHRAWRHHNTIWHVVAPTDNDVRYTCFEGESGLLNQIPYECIKDGIEKGYNKSDHILRLTNGTLIRGFSAQKFERLRGPQCHGGWLDELAAWMYVQETWDMYQFGARLGSHVQTIVTTTPKPVSIVRTLVKQAKEETTEVVITRGSTSENASNLAPSFLTAIEARYAGTRLGRQELDGELLEDVEGALWTLSLIDDQRINVPLGKSAMQVMAERGIDLSRIVVGVDPPASSTGAECGIVVMARGSDKRGYVLADRSKRGTPNEWANAAVAAFDEFNADAVVIEVNQGGDMATNTLRTIRPRLPITSVHASRGKATRAEPVSSLYQQGHVSHVGSFPALEDQQCTWVQGEASPDRMDALVWAATETIVNVKRGGAYGFS